MSIQIILTISEEDAEKLMQAFRDGKLEALGISEVKPQEPGGTVDHADVAAASSIAKKNPSRS